MEENRPSRTAFRVAVRRAAHQVLDDPVVFRDPVALRIIGPRHASQISDPQSGEAALSSPMLRAFLAARSRYAEEELDAAVGRGVGQYVVLGAGLDTFAYRCPYPENVLRVFEVDHPDTQAWKRELLEKAAIPVPQNLTFSPVDFETQTVEEGLREAGFDTGKSAFFSWLGVTQYLANDTVAAMLRFVASLPAASEYAPESLSFVPTRVG